MQSAAGSLGFLAGAHSENNVRSFEECSVSRFLATGLPFLKGVEAPLVEEYVDRRNRLARGLVQAGVDAFVVEPGYTFQYFANVSQPDWEVWEVRSTPSVKHMLPCFANTILQPEERPFLLVIRPVKHVDGTVSANSTFLSPAFEAERARLLGMPFLEPLSIIEWEEHWNPYSTLLTSSLFADIHPAAAPKVMVDEEMRDFIQRGLSESGFDVIGLGGTVEAVRQTKSSVETSILRAVNTGTVEAIRAMRQCMYPGLTESEVATVLDHTLQAAGLAPFFDIVLFDENASNPHGGTNGTKTLSAETFVLIDVGAHLHGYSSDVCRTFFPPFLPQTRHVKERLRHKLEVWDLVLSAQTASVAQFRPGQSAASVDIAARSIIEDAGYGNDFTHRVGHGIGIKAHESPYLNKGNTQTLLQAGMAFTSEPGVYLVGKFGVRHEDIFIVREGDHEPDCLSGIRAKGPWDP